jgi:hypothetical protein
MSEFFRKRARKVRRNFVFEMFNAVNFSQRLFDYRRSTCSITVEVPVRFPSKRHGADCTVRLRVCVKPKILCYLCSLNVYQNDCPEKSFLSAAV